MNIIFFVEFILILNVMIYLLTGNTIKEKQMFADLYQMRFLISNPTTNFIKTFWSCFRQALDDNKKTKDGKRRILSIIANDFTYKELEHNLGVRNVFIISIILSI